MNLYNAIMKAADHIERNPDEFNWNHVDVPDAPGCGTPGCALGWIASFLGCTRDGLGFVAAAHALGVGDEHYIFYRRLDEFAPFAKWRQKASVCAFALRAYAAKYHGHEKPASPPDWNALAGKWTVGDDVRSQELA